MLLKCIIPNANASKSQLFYHAHVKKKPHSSRIMIIIIIIINFASFNNVVMKKHNK